jgi:hypothetical protein
VQSEQFCAAGRTLTCRRTAMRTCVQSPPTGVAKEAWLPGYRAEAAPPLGTPASMSSPGRRPRPSAPGHVHDDEACLRSERGPGHDHPPAWMWTCHRGPRGPVGQRMQASGPLLPCGIGASRLFVSAIRRSGGAVPGVSGPRRPLQGARGPLQGARARRSPSRANRALSTERTPPGLVLLPLGPAVSQLFSLVGALARLGCTRIGSPGIFGVQARETPC